MNLSMQMVRGLGALAMFAAISAYALTQPVAVNVPAADGHEVAVAHSRLEIVVVSATDNAPRYQVASVRVGAPIEPTPVQTRLMVMHSRRGDTRS
jgi:hypothetical protein